MRQGTNNDKKVFIIESVYQDIIRECLQWKDVETGTILIGTQILEGYLVIKAFSPGPQAKRLPGSFSPQIEYVQKELDMYRIKHPGEDFLGIHHQHPGQLTRPSHGDLQQAKTILSDPAYKINGKLLSLISIRHNGRVQIHAYHISGDDPEFRPLGMKVLSDNDPMIAIFRSQSLFLRQSPATLKKLAGPFWEDPEFQWHLTIYGKKRLEEDIQGINREMGIQPKVIKTESGALIIKLKRLVMLFPREYPLNPPKFFIQGKEGRLKEIEGKKFLKWNSTSTLGDIIQPYRSYIHSKQLTRWLVRPIRIGNQWVAMSLIALGNRLNNISLLKKEE